jgi:hypothetical protein
LGLDVAEGGPTPRPVLRRQFVAKGSYARFHKALVTQVLAGVLVRLTPKKSNAPLKKNSSTAKYTRSSVDIYKWKVAA